MALFNAGFKKKRNNNKKNSKKKTKNRAGGLAYVQSPKMKLASLLLTSFAQDQYYRSAKTTFKEIVALLSKVDPLFAAKAGVYARTQFGMRSITHVLAAELAAYASGQPWAKAFYNRVVYRPDDMLEIATYYKSIGGKNLPNAMKKGFANAFNRFDAYQLAKYRGEGKDMKLVDMANLVHPKPTDRNGVALKQLVEGTLRNTETWETLLTKAGQNAKTATQKAKLKQEVWKSLLKENKLGYFALVRNLRNIAAQAPNMIDLVCNQLTDENRIKRSLVLPFRLLTAYKQLNGNDSATRKLKYALEAAIDVACNNVPNLANTLVVVDNSGSMSSPVANSQHIKCNELGAMFGMILAKRSNADILEFGTTARYIKYNLRDSVLSFSSKFEYKNQVGHGTNFHAIFQTAKKRYDRIVIFSDMQGWMGYNSPDAAYKSYKKRYSCNPFIYSFDLRGYGTLQFPENKIFTLAGFSEKVFDLMTALETSPQAMIAAIEQTEL